MGLKLFGKLHDKSECGLVDFVLKSVKIEKDFMEKLINPFKKNIDCPPLENVMLTVNVSNIFWKKFKVKIQMIRSFRIFTNMAQSPSSALDPSCCPFA